MAVNSAVSVLFFKTLVSQLSKSSSFKLFRCLAASGTPFQPSHENRYPFTNWSTFAPPKWSKFTPPLTPIKKPPQQGGSHGPL